MNLVKNPSFEGGTFRIGTGQDDAVPATSAPPRPGGTGQSARGAFAGNIGPFTQTYYGNEDLYLGGTSNAWPEGERDRLTVPPGTEKAAVDFWVRLQRTGAGASTPFLTVKGGLVGWTVNDDDVSGAWSDLPCLTHAQDSSGNVVNPPQGSWFHFRGVIDLPPNVLQVIPRVSITVAPGTNFDYIADWDDVMVVLDPPDGVVPAYGDPVRNPSPVMPWGPRTGWTWLGAPFASPSRAPGDDRIQREINRLKPAGVIIEHRHITGANFDALSASQVDFDDVLDTFLDFGDVQSNPTKQ